jgi:methylenetetrahydrofolate reductase (NADPH)
MSTELAIKIPVSVGHIATANSVAEMIADASLEVAAHDLADIERARAYLGSGRRIYVSHLPRQTWSESETACRTLRDAGFIPIPHIPVRLIEDVRSLNVLLEGLVSRAGVEELMLLAGDYTKPLGAFTRVADVLRTNALSAHGIRRISMAGHPEGHPRVPADEIRRAEIDKCLLADELGLEASLVTQFFFEGAPFNMWADALRSQGVRARLIAGVTGPTRLSYLLKMAVRCGVGPSIRALAARPGAMMKLLSEYTPDELLETLAAQSLPPGSRPDGIHLFSPGGFLRTSAWLDKSVSAG